MDAPTRTLPLAVREALAWCGAVAYPVVLFFAVAAWPTHRAGDPLFILPAVLAVLPIGLLRRRPLPALALVLAGSLTVVAGPVSGQPGQAPLGYAHALVACLAVGLIAAARPVRTAVPAAVVALGVLAWAATYYATSGSDQFTTTVAMIGLALVAATVVGSSVRQRREHARAVQAQAATQAITAERLRIARELHDLVAHNIGVIAIQAGTGRRVVDTQPAEARASLAAIEAASRETLAGLRRMLGALRQSEPDPPPLGAAPGLAGIDQLVTQTGLAGVRVDVQLRGDQRPLPPEVDIAAFRIVQEAVTNVVRHAGTGECRVVVDFRDEELSIEIVDHGRSTGAAGTGYGITGMRERAGLLGGRFTAGQRAEGGFRVAARLPAPAPVR